MVSRRGHEVGWTNWLASNIFELRNTRNTRKGLVDEALMLDLGIVAEIDQQPELLPGRLQESVALFLVHLETGTDDPVALRFEDDPFLSHFRAFRVFRSCSPPGQQGIELHYPAPSGVE